MLKILLSICCFITLNFIFIPTISAWDDAGHKTTAYIAWETMSPEARESAFDLLRKAPEDSDLSVYYNFYESRSENVKRLELFMIAATWSDIIKNRDLKVRYEKYNNGDWHYADIFWRQDANGKAEIIENFGEESGKAVNKLYDFEKTLRDPAASVEEKAIALAWFLHVGGDIHQPLHNASRVTEDEPKGDQGGNLFLISTKDTPRDLPRNLHSFWDSIITRNMPRKEEACDTAYIPEIAREIMEKHPYSKIKNYLDLGDYRKWNHDGYNFLPTAVYPTDLKRGEYPSKEYQENSFKIGQMQIALAGYRLGATLNRILGNKQDSIANCRVIRKVLYPISKRPTPKQKMRIALLNTCPENKGMVARPMTTIMIDGKPVLYEFDVVKVFETEQEAKKYAKENGITDSDYK